MRAWCARPSCRHAPSRHSAGRCSCGCQGWEASWPHWWRRLAVETWSMDDAAWWQRHELASVGYDTEAASHREVDPRPTFKKTLVALAGSPRPEDEGSMDDWIPPPGF